MRAFLVVMIIALLTASAYAEGMSGGKRRHGPEQRTEQKKNKVDEKAYQSTLDKLPDKPYDPWQNVREKPQSK